MAFIYIQEFPGSSQVVNYVGMAPQAEWPPIGSQKVAFAAPSAKLGATTRVVRLTCDAICSYVVSRGPPASGVTVAAAATDARLAAGAVEYLAVQPGSVIAAITNT